MANHWQSPCLNLNSCCNEQSRWLAIFNSHLNWFLDHCLLNIHSLLLPFHRHQSCVQKIKRNLRTFSFPTYFYYKSIFIWDIWGICLPGHTSRKWSGLLKLQTSKGWFFIMLLSSILIYQISPLDYFSLFLMKRTSILHSHIVADNLWWTRALWPDSRNKGCSTAVGHVS